MSGFDSEREQAFHERQDQKVQDLVAACMALLDFEYIPAVHPHGDPADGVDSAETIAREQGFGITTQLGDASVDIPQRFIGDGWTNPNDAITAAMSEAERQAYYDALYGITEMAVDVDGMEEATSADSDAGCVDQAQDEVYSFFDVVGQLDLESLSHAIRTDPQMNVVFDDWSQCMKAKGHEYDNPSDMYGEVYIDLKSRLEEIIGPSDSGYPFYEISPEEVEQLTPAELADENDGLTGQVDAGSSERRTRRKQERRRQAWMCRQKRLIRRRWRSCKLKNAGSR